ncbi:MULTISPECIES: CoA transferase [unclassified Pseudomonas]|uniref:CoA transferase n=1 Tax=unclassified Pseudomonas TaxID=196821 RepID=UPI00244A5C58|nr:MULTISPECIES: CoA transferase [unclassified Pseudomonas]MDH0304620.1 CoA transferase [Pseudomonas sp. GD04091]MDH1987807.1 CoA transferase [Pseudomonas sp. GD03689]
MRPLLDTIAHALTLDAAAVRWHGIGALPCAFAVTGLASASFAACGLALADLLQGQLRNGPQVSVDRRLASFWFGTSLRPLGWEPPPLWDAIAGDYKARDGWIRLHTNAPHHRAAALQVLDCPADRASVASHVLAWDADTLESAIVANGGCAARMRGWQEWCAHPQGQAVNREPLILREPHTGAPLAWQGSEARPLRGIKVLDLTRILAGPIATRLLAGFGADVLRLDPPDWEEPAVAAEVTLGKRCARLDLRTTDGKRIFLQLLAEADVLVHGYRADALEHLGLGAQQRRRLNPGLIDVSLNAYGWSGPWRDRRGFDSLVQMSTGIAREGMRWRQTDRPVPLPVQALDHATGYLMAAEAIRALGERLRSGMGCRARLSLARTAKLLVERGTMEEDLPLAAESPEDLAPTIERTAWGEAQRISGPLKVGEALMGWERGASQLGSAQARW